MISAATSLGSIDSPTLQNPASNTPRPTRMNRGPALPSPASNALAAVSFNVRMRPLSMAMSSPMLPDARRMALSILSSRMAVSRPGFQIFPEVSTIVPSPFCVRCCRIQKNHMLIKGLSFHFLLARTPKAHYVTELSHNKHTRRRKVRGAGRTAARLKDLPGWKHNPGVFTWLMFP
ncbi:hypothetical protein KL86DPRO_70198 [uncultured delta proteobacterium]|uniref:Uncharacterized protein n=1 Tax=uncultured delta proteobacterium TaxID=34034 RepID=A0A212KHR9_9DELT|nr:hypothetical protein KL86DPRO_70198 [uncultured delta proteobacterium]